MLSAKAALLCTPLAWAFGHMVAIAQRPTQPRRSVQIIASSRRSTHPATSANLEEVRRNAAAALAKSKHFTAVSGSTPAELAMQLEFEPNFRYGQFHYQSGPFVFLTLRDLQSGRLVYCAYSRNGRFRDVTRHLVADMDQHVDTVQSDSLPACAEAALRPLQATTSP